MRTKLSILCAAVIAAVVGVNSANADITLSMTQINLSSFGAAAGHAGTASDGATLDANGWIVYKVTATASGSSTLVGGYDFEGATTQTEGLGFGAYDTFHQVLEHSQPTPTGGSSPATGDLDSFFILSGATGAVGAVPAPPAIQPSEDFVHSGSPLTDQFFPPGQPFYTYGTGTQVHAGDAIQNSSAVVDIGWFVVPKNSSLHLVGQVYDQNGAGVPISIDQIFGAPVPEPASLGVLSMGAMALLARRRRKV